MKLTTWDITQELISEEDIIDYLEVALEEGDDDDRRIAIQNIIRTMECRIAHRSCSLAL